MYIGIRTSFGMKVQMAETCNKIQLAAKEADIWFALHNEFADGLISDGTLEFYRSGLE